MSEAIQTVKDATIAPSDRPDAKSLVLIEAAHEFVFGVVGHIGSGTSEVTRSFKALLERRKDTFQATILKARESIEEWAASASQPFPSPDGKSIRWPKRSTAVQAL